MNFCHFSSTHISEGSRYCSAATSGGASLRPLELTCGIKFTGTEYAKVAEAWLWPPLRCQRIYFKAWEPRNKLAAGVEQALIASSGTLPSGALGAGPCFPPDPTIIEPLAVYNFNLEKLQTFHSNLWEQPSWLCPVKPRRQTCPCLEANCSQQCFQHVWYGVKRNYEAVRFNVCIPCCQICKENFSFEWFLPQNVNSYTTTITWK